MSLSNGDIYVFYSSVKICLKEVTRLKETGAVNPSDLSATEAELSCMKAVLEREANLK